MTIPISFHGIIRNPEFQSASYDADDKDSKEKNTYQGHIIKGGGQFEIGRKFSTKMYIHGIDTPLNKASFFSAN